MNDYDDDAHGHNPLTLLVIICIVEFCVAIVAVQVISYVCCGGKNGNRGGSDETKTRCCFFAKIDNAEGSRNLRC